MLTLYDYYRSTASFRVRIALHLKNITYTKIPIHLVNNNGEQFSKFYQTLNPQQLVPTLQHHDNIINQSIAIIEYLDDIYPEPKLIPNDPYLKALVKSFALTIVADTHPLNNLRVLKFLSQEFHITEEQKTQWYHHWVATTFAALEKQLATSTHTGMFCFGNTPTLADLCLVPQMFNARRFDCPINAYPILIRIDEHCRTLPGFKQAWPHE